MKRYLLPLILLFAVPLAAQTDSVPNNPVEDEIWIEDTVAVEWDSDLEMENEGDEEYEELQELEEIEEVEVREEYDPEKWRRERMDADMDFAAEEAAKDLLKCMNSGNDDLFEEHHKTYGTYYSSNPDFYKMVHSKLQGIHREEEIRALMESENMDLDEIAKYSNPEFKEEVDQFTSAFCGCAEKVGLERVVMQLNRVMDTHEALLNASSEEEQAKINAAMEELDPELEKTMMALGDCAEQIGITTPEGPEMQMMATFAQSLKDQCPKLYPTFKRFLEADNFK